MDDLEADMFVQEAVIQPEHFLNLITVILIKEEAQLVLSTLYPMECMLL